MAQYATMISYFIAVLVTVLNENESSSDINYGTGTCKAIT